MIAGLHKAIELVNDSGNKLQIYMDSQLVIKQILGEYRVKNARLQPLHREVKNLLTRFPAWNARHIPRAENHEADSLANAAYS